MHYDQRQEAVDSDYIFGNCSQRSALRSRLAREVLRLSPAESPDSPTLRSGGAHRTVLGLGCCANVGILVDEFLQVEGDFTLDIKQAK
jgi:hypothetical protein